MSAIYQYTLTYDGTPTVLTHNPAGWDDVGLSFVRHLKYHSVFRSFTLSLRFPRKEGGGADVIEDAYNTDGIKADVQILIEKRNTQTDDFDTWFSGILDFHPEKVKFKRDFIEISIIDGSKEQRFIARDEINYDLLSETSTDNVAIDPFVSSPKTINLSKIDIYLHVDMNGNMTVENSLSGSPCGVAPPSEGYEFISGDLGTLIEQRVYYTPDSIDINEIGDRLEVEEGTAWVDRQETVYTNDTDFESSINFTDLSSIVDGMYIKAINPGLGTGNFHIIIGAAINTYDEDDNIIDNENVVFANILRSGFTGTLNIPVSQDFTGFESYTFTVPAGGYLTVKTRIIPMNITTAWSGCCVYYHGTYTMNFNFTEISLGAADSECDCFFPHEAFTRLIQLMTSETDTAKLLYSEFFGRTDSEFVTYGSNGAGSLDAVTNGFKIRQFPNRALNTSMIDLFKTFDCFYNLGLGYDRTNERFFIEQKSEFYKNTLMFDLGEVSELEIYPDKTAYFSQILSGYKNKVEYEQLQGAYEYNLKSEHSISTYIKEKMDLGAPFYTDSIGIELARRKPYSGYAAEDTKFDENVYIIRTDGTDVVVNGSSVSGFDGIDQYYNIIFTPRENLIRWSNILRPAIYKESPLVKFVQSQKGINISYTNQNGHSVNELDDLTGTDLVDTALFIPEILEFKAPINETIIATLNSDPHGYIDLNFDGGSYQGFLISVETEDYNEQATWKLKRKELITTEDVIFEDNEEYLFEDDQQKHFEN